MVIELYQLRNKLTNLGGYDGYSPSFLPTWFGFLLALFGKGLNVNGLQAAAAATA